MRAFEELHLPLSATLSRATVIKVAELLGARELVLGTFHVEDCELTIQAHTIRVDAGRARPAATRARAAHRTVRASRPVGPRPDAGVGGAGHDRLRGRRWAPSRATSRACSRQVRQHGRRFSKPRSQDAPGFERARLSLWEVRTDQGDHAAALAAIRRNPFDLATVRAGSFLRRDLACSISSAMTMPSRRMAGLLRQPQGIEPAMRGAVSNNMGVIQIRRGATPQTGTPIYFLTKATEQDPGATDAYFNLGYAYVLDKNFQAGDLLAARDRAPRLRPMPTPTSCSAVALQATGNPVEAGSRAGPCPPAVGRTTRSWRVPPPPTGRRWPRGLERVLLDPDGSGSLHATAIVGTSAQRDQRDLAAFHLERGRRLFDREQDTEAMAELRRVVYLSPYEAQAHLLIGRILPASRATGDAVDALKISIWSSDTAGAHVALAEAYLKTGNAQGGPDGDRSSAGDGSGVRRGEARARPDQVGCRPAEDRPDVGWQKAEVTSCQEGGRMRGASGRLAWALTAIAVAWQWRCHGKGRSDLVTHRPGRYLAEVDGIIHPVVGRVPPRRDRRGGRRRRRRAGHHAAHARAAWSIRPATSTPQSSRPGRRSSSSSGPRAARGLGRIPHHHRRRRRGDGARDAYRRRAPGVGRRREGRRDDGEEDGVRRRRLRTDARRAAQAQRRRWSSRRSPRAGPYTEQEALDADAAAHRPRGRPTSPTCCASSTAARVTRFDGRDRDAPHRPGAATRDRRMTWAQRVLSALAHPQIAYLLLMLGTLGLTIELWTPGRRPAGRRRRDLPAAGVLRASRCCRSATPGILLILFGMVLLMLEVKVTSYGLLAAGGSSACCFGSMMLIDSPLPELQIGLRLIVPITLARRRASCSSWCGWRCNPQRSPAGHRGGRHAGRDRRGADAVRSGRRRAASQTHGEIWTATADEPIHAGDTVRVVAVEGLLLTVASAPQPRAERVEALPGHSRQSVEDSVLLSPLLIVLVDRRLLPGRARSRS